MRSVSYSRLLLTDAALCGHHGRSLAGHIQTARLPTGSAVVWREKALAGRALLEAGRAVAAACRGRGLDLLIHNHIGLVHELGAKGVHLSSDQDPRRARGQLGPAAVVGQSFHAGDEGRDVGALDYVTVSPVFAPGSKPGDQRPTLGLDGLALFCRAMPVPVYALGGMGREARHAAGVQAGAAGSAQLGAWLGAP